VEEQFNSIDKNVDTHYKRFRTWKCTNHSKNQTHATCKNSKLCKGIDSYV